MRLSAPMTVIGAIVCFAAFALWAGLVGNLHAHFLAAIVRLRAAPR